MKSLSVSPARMPLSSSCLTNCSRRTGIRVARNRAGRLGELWGHSTHDRYGNHEVGTEQLWLTDQLGHQFLEVGRDREVGRGPTRRGVGSRCGSRWQWPGPAIPLPWRPPAHPGPPRHPIRPARRDLPALRGRRPFRTSGCPTAAATRRTSRAPALCPRPLGPGRRGHEEPAPRLRIE